ncbi:MAG: sulfur-oxidizing protein SoxZ [Gammaproteobacteria bacterium]|jgi:sulfur-oxidizing protein SoxZ
MSDTIKLKIKLRGDVAEVKCLVVHPMETGARKDPDSDELVPRHHITQMSFALNDRPVLLANCGTSVAKNPYFRFSFAGAAPGDRFSVNWEDVNGKSDLVETTLE